jgi:uncharacterized protein YjbJ (UPF0337 family)
MFSAMPLPDIAQRSRHEKSSARPALVLRGTIAQHFRCAVSRQQRNTIMDREHVKGAADKAKGAIKEGAGKLSGDKDMETEGKIDKAKGSAHDAAGDVKDAARDAADALKNKQEG